MSIESKEGQIFGIGYWVGRLHLYLLSKEKKLTIEDALEEVSIEFKHLCQKIYNYYHIVDSMEIDKKREKFILKVNTKSDSLITHLNDIHQRYKKSLEFVRK